MKPEDHIDEKEQLRQSIKKGCRANTIFYISMGILFLINGIVHVDKVSESKLYLCPLIALMLVSAIAMGFYALIYDSIRRKSTAREMQKYLSLMGSDSIFTKLILITMTLCIVVTAVLGLIDKCAWYVILLAVIGIIAVIGGLWWILKHSGKGESRIIDIEKLMALEDAENNP